ncbi:MAG: DUF4836 family protein [Prevotella sp.]|jgi:hypothetical protein|nr:DUF4836 family protein [Prevotella sp.]
MKKNKLFLAAAIIAVAFASCKKKSSELANAIPVSAAYVACVDIQSIVTKSDYDIFKNETVQRGINLAKGMLGKKEAVDLLDALSKDVNALGLNIKGDCYIYTDYTTLGVVLGVNDAEKFKQALLDFSLPADAIEKENGIYIVSPDKNAVIVWSNNKFLLAMNISMMYKYAGEKIDMKAAALKQLTQDADESINSVPAFAEFLSAKKDISVYCTLTESYLDFIKSAMDRYEFPKETMDMLEEWNGAAFGSYVSFEKGEITGEGKVYYPNSDMEKKYKDISASFAGELKGEQLKRIPENAIFAASANVKGSGLYDYLGKVGLFSFINEKDAIGLLKTVLDEIDGEITFALTDIATVKKSVDWGNGDKYEYDSTEPQFTLLVNCKDGGKAFELLSAKISEEGQSLQEVAPDVYACGDAFIAVKGNTLSVTSNQASLDNPAATTSLSAFSKGKIIALGGDFKPLKEIVSRVILDSGASEITGGLIDLFDTYQLSGKLDVAEGKIIMTDKSQNSLASFCQWLDKTLTELNGKLNF